MAYDPQIAVRVRRLLRRRKPVEKTIVGGSLGFMVDGKLCCSVGPDRILVRVDPGARKAVLAKPHVRAMKMMGRTVKGFVFIDPPGYRTDKALKHWLTQSLAVIAKLPQGKRRPAAGKKKKKQ